MAARSCRASARTEVGARAWTYTYDGASRMTRAIGPNATGASITRDYRYDGAGNRIYVKEGSAAAVSTTYDLAGLPTTSSDGTTYTHDQIGDLTLINASGTANDWSYNYDAYGRMICAKNATACSGTGTITFTLDALDRLLSRVGTTTTAYTWSGLSEDPAKTADGKTTTYYAYTRSGSPLAQKAATLGFYLSDPHGDIVGTAAAGAVTGSRSYDPWGKPLASSGSTSYLGYQGDPTDPSTGQVDMGTRSYEPTLGRFSSRDVLFGDPTSPMSLNQYVYATDSPITFTDPTGMCACKKGNDAWRGSPQPDEDGGDVSVSTPTPSWPDPPPTVARSHRPAVIAIRNELVRSLYMYSGYPGADFFYSGYYSEVADIFSSNLTLRELKARAAEAELSLNTEQTFSSNFSRVGKGLEALAREMPKHLEFSVGVLTLAYDETNGLGVGVGCCRFGLRGIKDVGAAWNDGSDPRTRAVFGLSFGEGCYATLCGRLGAWRQYVGSRAHGGWSGPGVDFDREIGFYFEAGPSITFYVGLP